MMPKVVPEYKNMARHRILSAAQKLFAEDGFNKTSMDGIAKEVGVSKAALYLYFRSKEELLSEMYEASPSTFSEILDSSFGENRGKKDAEEFFEKMADQYASNPSFSFEVFSEAAHNSKIRSAILQKYEGYDRIISEFLGKKTGGRIKEAYDTRAFSFALIALWNGMETLLVAGITREEVKRAWITALIAIFSPIGRRVNDAQL